jgi:RNA polymerase sigma factor (sigma-70 family)
MLDPLRGSGRAQVRGRAGPIEAGRTLPKVMKPPRFAVLLPAGKDRRGEGAAGAPAVSGAQQRWRAVTNDEMRRRFAEVVVPHLDDCYGLARWLTGNSADAQDVVQEAALRAFRAIDSFSGANGRAWTLTIVRNCAYTWLAGNRPKAIVLTDDLEAAERTSAMTPDNAPASPETEIIARQDGARLATAMAALPVPFREVVVLRDTQGLAYREIAEVAGIPIGTVMSRLARGRELLIAAMRENER